MMSNASIQAGKYGLPHSHNTMITDNINTTAARQMTGRAWTPCTAAHLPLLCLYWASNCCCQSARRPQVGATLGFHLLLCLLHLVSKAVPGMACWFPWASRAGRLLWLKVACVIMSPLQLCRRLLIWKGLTGSVLLPVCLSTMLVCTAQETSTSAADHNMPVETICVQCP